MGLQPDWLIHTAMFDAEIVRVGEPRPGPGSSSLSSPADNWTKVGAGGEFQLIKENKESVKGEIFT